MGDVWVELTSENQTSYKLYDFDDYILEIRHLIYGIYGGSVTLILEDGLLLNKNHNNALAIKLMEISKKI